MESSRAGGTQGDKGRGGLGRSFGTGQLILVALGGIIGAGFFLGSGVPLHHAGLAAALAYLVGGLLMYLEVSLLTEVAAAYPVAGGFSAYARRFFGPWLGFVSGWMYWSSGVLVMASEVTAAAVFARRWLPHWPLWALALAFSVLMVAVNARGASGFALFEGVLSVAKVAALAGFIVLAAGVTLGLFGLSPPGPAPAGPLAGRSPWLPEGWRGFGGSLLFTMFAYTGTSVIALAAAETRNPAKTIPRAIFFVTGLVLALYAGSILLVSLLLPAAETGTGVSPFVLVLERLRLPWAAALMNVAVLVAALSSLNSALYSVSRMLFALAERGDASARLTKLTRRGVPWRAVTVSSLALGAATVLAYLLPKRAFLLISGATSLVSLFNWGLVALVHLRFRASHSSRSAASATFRMWGFPWTSYLTFALVLLITLSAWFLPAQRIGLAGLALLFAAFSGAYWLRARRRVG